MNPRRIQSMVLLTLLTVLLVVTGCGAPAEVDSSELEAELEAAQAALEEAQSGSANTELAAELEAAEAALVEAESAVAGAEQPASGDADSAPEDLNTDVSYSPPADANRLIIKNGEITLVVDDIRTGLDLVMQIATDNGGYVISNEVNIDNGYQYATITIAVEASNFEVAMRRLRNMAVEVRHESSSGEDVTDQVVDLESRLRNLRATRDRILGFLEQADTVEEALEINEQLAEIEGEIEEVMGRIEYLTGRAAYSTISIVLRPRIVPTETPTPTMTPTPTATFTPTPTSTPTPWSIGPTIKQATRTQRFMLQGWAEILVSFIIVPGPYLLVIGLFAFVTRGWWRKRITPPKAPPSVPPLQPDPEETTE